VLGGAGFSAEATEGRKSQFDVVAGGRTVFSKEDEGRFPEAEEILTALRSE
jgi:hypothetical protein